jgi:hypothetical protein
MDGYENDQRGLVHNLHWTRSRGALDVLTVRSLRVALSARWMLRLSSWNSVT